MYFFFKIYKWLFLVIISVIKQCTFFGAPRVHMKRIDWRISLILQLLKVKNFKKHINKMNVPTFKIVG